MDFMDLIHKMDTVKLIETIGKIKSQIGEHYHTIDQLRKKLCKIESDLYLTCDHNWVIDTHVMSEHTEYKCSKCGLGPHF